MQILATTVGATAASPTIPLRLLSAPSHRSDQVNLGQQGGRATLRRGFGIKHVPGTEGKLFRLEAGRILMEEVAEVCSRLFCRRNGQECPR
jgi:hypothetical protein